MKQINLFFPQHEKEAKHCIDGMKNIYNIVFDLIRKKTDKNEKKVFYGYILLGYDVKSHRKC